MTTSDLRTGTGANVALDQDALTLTTHTGQDGTVTVSVAGEVDAFTAPTLRSALDNELQRQPSELVLDLRGVRFLGSAGLAVLVQTQVSANARDIALRLIATTRPVTRPLEVTGLLDLFTVTSDPRWSIRPRTLSAVTTARLGPDANVSGQQPGVPGGRPGR